MLRRSVTVRADDVETVLDVLLEAVPEGVHDRSAGGELVELAWYGGREVPDLGDRVVAFASEEAPDDAAERRHAYREAVVIAGAVAIRGPDDPPGPDGVPEVVVESGHGEFGTGTHPTTQACLEALLRLDPGGALADLGCGAGTLAVVGARMGYAPVTAVDFEPASVEAARRNARRNGVELDVVRADLTRVAPPPAPTVVANVPLAVHLAVAGALPGAVRRLIASGVLAEDAAALLDAYGRAGLAEAGRLEAAGWLTTVLLRA